MGFVLFFRVVLKDWRQVCNRLISTLLSAVKGVMPRRIAQGKLLIYAARPLRPKKHTVTNVVTISDISPQSCRPEHLSEGRSVLNRGIHPSSADQKILKS